MTLTYVSRPWQVIKLPQRVSHKMKDHLEEILTNCKISNGAINIHYKAVSGHTDDEKAYANADHNNST